MHRCKKRLSVPPCAYFSLAVLLPLFLSACAGAVPSMHSHECELPEVRGNTTLSPHCVYKEAVIITSSNTTLDCRGAVLEGDNERPFGILINSKGKPLSDVTVRNCKVRHFTRSGIRITSDIAANKLSPNHEENYRRTPTRITLENVEVSGSGRVGIYFDDYVTHSTLSHSIVRDSYMSGIYLEHSSRNNKIVGNQIINNGHERFGKGKREGLAVDSSAYNLIEGNRFESNGAGGVFLYKNCGEHFSTGKSVIRWQHSDYNVIRNNTFVNEPVGIWLASRQNRDLSGFDCGDKPREGSLKFYPDYADNNVVGQNQFLKVKNLVINDGKHNSLMK
ncbi:right-handed parallel beta-helix repeat-containing protein [Rahnella aceris]|uniref:right-handed parallel beta-helix repeat-containing protein n=1 Tax=Rahnella sp. (strain Y9602) TaxID=2703885 RepID=UPI001420E912|nr:right-handed parallel beta-helix repeat-containing protein [Rahnella aceris]NIA87086.1 right-handed parallel beta-helix repeat-containing protein [Rahnella aceris]